MAQLRLQGPGGHYAAALQATSSADPAELLEPTQDHLETLVYLATHTPHIHEMVSGVPSLHTCWWLVLVARAQQSPMLTQAHVSPSVAGLQAVEPDCLTLGALA